MKIVYNSCYGGYSLSKLAEKKCAEYGMNLSDLQSLNYSRNHPIVVRVVEELGPRASGSHANLQVVEWPDSIPWTIVEYDGNESVEVDTHEFEGWLVLAEKNEGMMDLIERCRVFYQLAKDKE